MKLRILCVGRLRDDAERIIVDRYVQRFGQLGPALGFAPPAITELSESKAKSAAARKAAEASELRKKIPADAKIIMLSERGQTLLSRDFANRLGAMRDDGVRHLCLVIGGPDGLDQEFAGQAALQLSFGRMTLPHGLVRAVLAEQLYRAATILAGHPYHRD
jgi:23S rRNA (pseudouridine1915-N3)-methyltransferase